MHMISVRSCCEKLSLEQHSPPARIDSSQKAFFSFSSGFPLLCIPLSLTTVSSLQFPEEKLGERSLLQEKTCKHFMYMVENV